MEEELEEELFRRLNADPNDPMAAFIESLYLAHQQKPGTEEAKQALGFTFHAFGEVAIREREWVERIKKQRQEEQ